MKSNKMEKRKMTVAEARPLLEEAEEKKLISDDAVRCCSPPPPLPPAPAQAGRPPPRAVARPPAAGPACKYPRVAQGVAALAAHLQSRNPAVAVAARSGSPVSNCSAGGAAWWVLQWTAQGHQSLPRRSSRLTRGVL